MAVVNRPDLMADNRLHEVDPIDFNVLKDHGFHWFVQGENHDYLAEEFVELTETEMDHFTLGAEKVYAAFVKALKKVDADALWDDLNIPAHAVSLLQHSIRHQLGDYLIGRFDFAGGFGEFPLKTIEFNADTCSLMPETAIIQEEYWAQEKEYLPGEPFNELLVSLTDRFRAILAQHPDKSPSILMTSLGHEEDWLNVEVIVEAARNAGFTDVQCLAMDRIIFAPEEGIFIEFGEEDYRRYDFFFKMVPWDFILFEEPELFETLNHIILNDLCVVLNPPFAMLLQNKGLLKIVHETSPELSEVLKASYSASDFPTYKFVRKPFWGRMGENIELHDGQPEAKVKSTGDYGEGPMVFQELAPFYTDQDGSRYQASIFWTDEACAFCIRRQDHLIIDDDAEFLCHIVVEED